MKFITALTALAALAAKVYADCPFEKIGYVCCKYTSDVVYVDEDGTWGVENNDWCGIQWLRQDATYNPFAPQNQNQNQNQNQGNPWEQQQNNPWEQQQQQGGNSNTSGGQCSGKTLKSNTTLNIGGRKVIVKFPMGYTNDKNVPLLINYHYITGSAAAWEFGSQTAQAALNDGAIVAFPDGAQGPAGQAWNVGPCCTDTDDIQFTRDFIKEISSQACVDTKRIYAAGFSMGGGMSNYVGCKLSDVIAAAAPSAFDLSKEVIQSGQCKPTRGFPILNFRGTNDGVVPYAGGYSQMVSGKPITFIGAKENLKQWAKMNECTGEPTQSGDGCEMYKNCKDGAVVGLCTINGGGHDEGDGKKGWDFLKQFSL